MPFELDVSLDFEVFDKTEQATIRRARDTGGFDEQIIENALRHQVTEREAVASGGGFTSQDVIWNVPSLQVMGRPLPGDEIIEEDGDNGVFTWTVLQVDRATVDSRWRLTCRDLVLSESLDTTIDVERPNERQDAAASWTPDWFVAYAGLNGRVQEDSGEPVDERGKRGTRRLYTVFLGTRVKLSTTYRLVDRNDGTIYQIVGWTNPQAIDQLLTVQVERTP